jgi:hypothetical protein
VVANQGHSGYVPSNATKIVRIQVGVAQERPMPKNKKQKTAMTPSDDALKPAEEAVVLPANDDLALPGGDFVEDGEGAADTDYDIGYGKPPKKSQFKKGQSGNPAGRPKGSTSLTSVFKSLLEKKVAVVQNGKAAKMPMIYVLANKTLTKALAGEPQSLKLILKLYDKAFPDLNDNQPRAAGSSFDLTEEEWAAIEKSNLLKKSK